MIPALALGLLAATSSPMTFEQMVAAPVQFEGKRMIPLPDKLPRRALRFETAAENRGPAKRLPWVGLPKETDSGQRTPWAVLLGEMLFHSTRMLGLLDVRMGVSCNSCHPNGSTNPYVFTEHSYMVRGRIDLTTSYFSPTADNGILDAHVIPTLRGIRLTPPYQLDGKVTSLREQVRHVVVGEFGVPEPPPYLLDALVAFLEQLDPLPNPRLGPRGELVGRVTDFEKRGEAAFLLPREALGGRSCASCHIPEQGFTDGRTHPLGSQRERFDTPTLLGLVYTPPYLHDARARTIEDAVEEIDKLFQLGLTAYQVADLAAYLRAVGDEVEPYEPPSRARRAGLSMAFLDLLLEGPYAEDPLVWRMTLETVTGDLDELGLSQSREPAVQKAWAAWRALEREAWGRPPNAVDRLALAAARRELMAVIKP